MNDAIVRLIVDFAHTLGLKVTAEVVENDRQVASLTAMRGDLAQGFYFSKPRGSEGASVDGPFVANVLVKLCTNCGDQALIAGIGGLLGGLLPYLNRTRIA